MSQLSRYIQKQLATILNKIQQTPPKKCSSMKKIQTLINEAPLSQRQKTHINKSIRKIQSAMNITTSMRKNTSKSQYAVNLFYENMFLEEKNLNQEQKKKSKLVIKNQTESEYKNLLQKYQQLRCLRLKRQQYLNDLILKTQRMERLISLKQQNQQKYLKSKMLEEGHLKKKKQEEKIKMELKEATKNNRVKAVYSLVNKYNNFSN